MLNDGLLGQFGDVLQVETVLDPRECFLDAPPLVVKLSGAVGRIQLLVEQFGHEHALRTAALERAA